MREIKFRVYDYDYKKMRYLKDAHDSISFEGGECGVYHNYQTGYGEWFSDLMEYLGMRDKNGKSAYEGDKYINHDNGKVGILRIGGSLCYEVWTTEYNEDGSVYNNLPFASLDTTNFEITGTIYDTKEEDIKDGLEEDLK